MKLIKDKIEFFAFASKQNEKEKWNLRIKVWSNLFKKLLMYVIIQGFILYNTLGMERQVN